MGSFERFLTVWVALVIMVGVGLGVWHHRGWRIG